MKILVTGASGYLGGRLCNALVQQGYFVRALVRLTSILSALPAPTTTDGGALEIAYGDVTDYISLLQACSGCEIIFHAAALVEPWLPDPSKFLSVNVGGLKNLLEAVRETKTVEKVIYTSSFFALGPTDGTIADENQVHHEKFFCTEYERSKVESDKIALQAARDGVPIVVVYPGVIYGPGKVTAGNIVASMMIERFNGRLPGYIGYGNDEFSFSHVDDVVEGHIAAMRKGQLGERYLLTGENASFVHVFDLAAAVTESRRPTFHIPLWVIEAYGWLSVLFSRLTGKLPLISPPVYMLKVEGIAFRFLPDPVQIRNALELKAADIKSGFDGVPVFQSELLVVKKKNRRYCPVYFSKEDIVQELSKVSRASRGPGIYQHIVVGSLEDVLKKMEMSEKNSGWDDLIFIPPGKSQSQHIQEINKAR